MNYYNEFNSASAAGLRELIAAGLIPPGHVDDRPVQAVTPADLAGYTQCHFFAGVGGWSAALDLAGFPADRSVWTASCPCQPFSSSGRQKGGADDRHLWPVFFRQLLRLCRPRLVFGEQVDQAIGHGWLDGVSADLAAEGYACGPIVLGAHSVGAPHRRQRLYWVAHLLRGRCGPGLFNPRPARPETQGGPTLLDAGDGTGAHPAGGDHVNRPLGDRPRHRQRRERQPLPGGGFPGPVGGSGLPPAPVGDRESLPGQMAGGPGRSTHLVEPRRAGGPGGRPAATLGEPHVPGLEGHPHPGEHHQSGWLDPLPPRPTPPPSGALHPAATAIVGGAPDPALPPGERFRALWLDLPGARDPWAFSLAIPCRDGKHRRVGLEYLPAPAVAAPADAVEAQHPLCPLAHGLPPGVGGGPARAAEARQRERQPARTRTRAPQSSGRLPKASATAKSNSTAGATPSSPKSPPSSSTTP